MYKSYLLMIIGFPQLDRPGTLRTVQIVHDPCALIKVKKRNKLSNIKEPASNNITFAAHYKQFTLAIVGFLVQEWKMGLIEPPGQNNLSMPAGSGSDSGNYK